MYIAHHFILLQFNPFELSSLTMTFTIKIVYRQIQIVGQNVPWKLGKGSLTKKPESKEPHFLFSILRHKMTSCKLHFKQHCFKEETKNQLQDLECLTIYSAQNRLIYIVLEQIYIYKNIYLQHNQEKNFLKSLRLLPLSIYLHKTATISKYLQFLIYKLNESVVGTK